MTPKRLILRIIIGAVLFLLIIALIYWAGRSIELSSSANIPVRGDLAGRFQEPKIVDFKGTLYQYRQDLLTILVMGIDQTTQSSSLASGFRNGGQADFLILLVFDKKEKTITPIHIDRDTMTEITVLGVLGNEAGTRNAQICLSHGFGDGKEQSCLFTVDAVRKLMYGVDIDFFIALNLDAIPVLNDSLGGVPVTLKDDFTVLDPAMQKGVALALKGKQAEYYIRNRMGIGIGTNEARMERQREYLAGAGKKLDEKLSEDGGFLENLFNSVNDYILTDMKRGRMINEFYGSKDFEKKEIIPLLGNHIIGEDGFMEFHADESFLEQLVLKVFYLPQK